MSLRFPLRMAWTLVSLFPVSVPALASLTPDFGLPAIVTYSGRQIVFDATDAGGLGAGTTVTFTLRQPDGTTGRFSTETDEAGRFVIALDARGLAGQDSIQVSIRRNGVFTFTLGAVRLSSESTSNALPRPWSPTSQPNENVQVPVCASETCSAGPCSPFSADLFTRSNEPMDSGVNLADGTVFTHYPVLSFATRRMGFDLRLHHQSMTEYAGPMGNGWSHSFNMFIVQNEATRGAVVTPDLRVFSIDGGPTQAPGEWELPEGFFSRLRQDRVHNRWILTHHTGVVFQFLLAREGLPGPLIQIDDTNGSSTRARLDPSGFLATVETDLGQAVRFGYDAAGRLAFVKDPLDRDWTFSHDASGNLTAAATPPTETADVAAGREITDADLPAVMGVRARATRFFYEDSERPDFITRIVDPRGAEVRAYTYHQRSPGTVGNLDEGRVKEVRINGGTVSFLYRFGPDVRPVPKAPLEIGNSIVRVNDREGNTRDLEIQGRDNGPIEGRGAFGLRRRLQWTERGKGNAPLRSGEPDAWETRWLHDCDCLSPIEVSQPFRSDAPPRFDGNRIPEDAPVELFAYNDRRQVTGYEFRSGTGELIRWARTYDTFERFSRLLTYTEPRGFDTSPVYTGLGFTHRYVYDPAGNLTTHTSPTVTRGVPGGSQPIVEAWTYNPFGQPLSHRDPNGNLTTFTYFEGPGRARGVNARDGFAGYMASMTRGASGSTGDALDLTTRFRVNVLGWVTERIDPANLSYLTEYTTVGEVRREIKPEVTLQNGAQARYETRSFHDAAGNRVLEGERNVDFDGTVPANEFIDRFRSFDAVGNVLSDSTEVDEDAAHDLVTRYAYDRNDKRKAVQEPEGNRKFYVYDERNKLLNTFYGIAPGQAVSQSYPADKRATALSGTTFVGLETPSYDAPGNTVERRDGRGHVTRSFFDFANRLVARRDSNGNGWKKAFDDASNVLTEDRGVVSENGTIAGTPLARSYFRYDERNRSYETVRDLDPATDESGAVEPDDGSSSATRTFFDAGGRIVGRLDAEGNPSAMSYDSADRLVSTLDALGNSRTFFYDVSSNVTQEHDLQLPGPGASGRDELYVVCHSHDQLNRRVKIRVHGLNGTGVDQMTLFALDSRGNVRRVQDPEGNATLSTFDDADRRIQVQRLAQDGSLLSLSEHLYDGNGNTLADVAFRNVDDPASAEVTAYAYDRLDRRNRIVYPDGGVVETAYDATSNPVTMTEQRGVRFTNTYDDGNRLIAQDIALPSGVPGETRREYAYDSLDRLIQADNDFSRVQREYDPLSRLTAETQEIRLAGEGDYKEPIRLQYTYDRQGNRTSMEVLDGSRSDLEVRQTFDDLNRVQSIAAQTSSAGTIGPVADYAYIGPSRLQKKTLGNGAFLTETYDRKPRIARHVWQAPGGALLAGFEYGYDDADNALRETFLHDGGLHDNFGYNARYELTGASFRQASPVDYRSFTGSFRDRFEYDGVLNRTEADFGNPFDSAPVTSDLYEANPANEYTRIDRNGTSFVPVHDAAGNATELLARPVAGPEAGHDVTATARYDAFNHLFDVQAGTNPKQHSRYDVFGRRIAVLELDGATAGPQILPGSRRFLYSGWTDVEERLFTPNASLSEASSTLDRVYVYGRRIDELLLTSIDTGTALGLFEYYALDNRLGSIMSLLDAHDPGNIVASYRYSAYGEPTVVTGPALSSTVNPFFFTGRRLDGKTGLYEYRMRQMEPVSGRFVQRDPIGWWIDTTSANAYEYVGNNPTNRSDPSGLFWGHVLYYAVRCATSAVCRAVVEGVVTGAVIAVDKVLHISAPPDQGGHSWGKPFLGLRPTLPTLFTGPPLFPCNCVNPPCPCDYPTWEDYFNDVLWRGASRQGPFLTNINTNQKSCPTGGVVMSTCEEDRDVMSVACNILYGGGEPGSQQTSDWIDCHWRKTFDYWDCLGGVPWLL